MHLPSGLGTVIWTGSLCLDEFVLVFRIPEILIRNEVLEHIRQWVVALLKLECLLVPEADLVKLLDQAFLPQVLQPLRLFFLGLLTDSVLLSDQDLLRPVDGVLVHYNIRACSSTPNFTGTERGFLV